MTKNALREPDRSFFARIPLAFCAPSYTRSDRKPYLGCLSCHSHPICPCGAPSPRGEGCDTGIPSSKQAVRRPCEPIRSPASSSRAQPRDLYCTAAICTHAPSLKRHLGASFFAFPSLTIYRSARRIPLLRPS